MEEQLEISNTIPAINIEFRSLFTPIGPKIHLIDWHCGIFARMYKVESKQGERTVEIELIENGIIASLDGNSIQLDIAKINEKELHVLNQNKGYSVELVALDQEKKEVALKINGVTYHYKIKDQYDLLLKELGLSNQSNQKVSSIKAPMPGLVLDIMVEENQSIKTTICAFFYVGV